MANDNSWLKIYNDLEMYKHDFNSSPFPLSAAQIKVSCQEFTQTNEKEVRILCKQDSREARPKIFKENGLFLLPIKNGHYVVLKGEGYIDISPIEAEPIVYKSKLDFVLETSQIGNSEMQHLDFAYASSLIRTFMDDESLALTIRGRKYTPEFSFKVGNQEIKTSSIQTEVDAGYEGRKQVVLVEAKNSGVTNTIIRQLYFPFRQWQEHTTKKVSTLFFDKEHRPNGRNYDIYSIWQYIFNDVYDYNSIKLERSSKFIIESP